MSTVPGIYKKLHAIMKACPYIQKDKKNPHFGYTYASEAAIKTHLQALLVEHGVIFSASGVNHQVVEIGRNEKGKGRYRTTLDLAYRFIDIDDGSVVEGSMAGAGVDDEDKGTYKAITGALKYCLTSTFIIPTGDDPEAADGERKPEKKERPANRQQASTTIGVQPVRTVSEYINEAQLNRFHALTNERKWSVDEQKAMLADFGVNSRKYILIKDYERICNIVTNQTYVEYEDYKRNPPAKAV